MFTRAARILLLFCLLLASCTASQPTTTAPLPTTAIPSPTAVQITNTPLPPTTAPAHTNTPTPTTAPPRPSVLFILWDGGQANLVYNLMSEGKLPHFAALAEQGVRAEYALSVDPPLTASAQNSIATGSYPSHTGIVSNAYHNPTDSFYWYRTGYDELLDQAEPVWVTASRAGLKTAALFFIGGSPMLPGQTADYTIGYGVRDAYSRPETVKLEPATEAWQGDLPISFSPPYEGSFTIQEVSRVYLYVLDSTDDQTANYDTVILNTERSISASAPQLKVDEWGPLVLLPRVYAGADFLIQKITQEQAAPTQVDLFYSNVYHNVASPRSFLEELNQKFDFFPAGADYYALEHGWITPEENLYLLERAARWMAEVTAWVYTQYQPDLLFTWQDGFDTAGHSYLLRDPRQLNYTPENAQQYAAYYARIVQVADQALETMLQPVDLGKTTVMMAADHGMSLLHTTVYVNTILEHASLLTLDKKDYVVVNKTKAFAVASGGAVNVYINLEGHEKEGTVTAEEYPQVQAHILKLLNSLTDPATGEVVFQRVLRQDELASLHLDHLNSGDVFAQAYPGYSLDGWRGNNFVFAPAEYYGQHGYDSALPDMHALFIAAGKGFPNTGQVIPPVRIIDYAPTIAALLGFTPAPTVDGQSILK